MVFALILMGSSYVLAPLAVGAQQKIVIDIGLAAISIFSVILIVLLGAGSFHQEKERGILKAILVKPITRADFILGKYSGTVLTAAMVIVLMAAVHMVVMLVSGAPVTENFFWAVYLTVAEAALVTAVLTFFAAFTSPILGSFFTISVVVAGHLSKDLLALQGETRILDALEEAPIMVRLHKDEAQLLRPYVMELAERSAKQFAEKYKFKPTRPIHVELYSNHDDFAVRTMGMPGIGLLGVTFGYMVAMDSPSARDAGSYHWGTTLWHEMAHVITLEATNHLVPRWFSEGISVYEEWQTGPRPGEVIPLTVIQAIAEDKLLPVADLDAGFVRPTYPAQVAVSYTQAGLICLYISERWGHERLVGFLDAFARRMTTPEAVPAILEVSPAEFDEAFSGWLQARL